MTVEQDRWLAFGAAPLGEDQWVAIGFNALGIEACGLELVHDELAAPANVVLVLGIGRNRRNTQILEQLLEISVFLPFDTGQDIVTIRRHGVPSS